MRDIGSGEIIWIEGVIKREEQYPHLPTEQISQQCTEEYIRVFHRVIMTILGAKEN